MEVKTVFDYPEVVGFDAAKNAFISKILPPLIKDLGLKTALDSGCGIGRLSDQLKHLDLAVTAFDMRDENIKIAKSRYSSIDFRTANIEDIAVREFGVFDATFCFGVLYHLENPFLAIRNLYAMTKKLLIIESVSFPSKCPSMMLFDEGQCENQSQNFTAFYPSENCLIMMMQRAGFPFVYRFRSLPSHNFYKRTLLRLKERTMLLACKFKVDYSFLELCENHPNPLDGRWWDRAVKIPLKPIRFIRRLLK